MKIKCVRMYMTVCWQRNIYIFYSCYLPFIIYQFGFVILQFNGLSFFICATLKNKKTISIESHLFNHLYDKIKNVLRMAGVHFCSLGTRSA